MLFSAWKSLETAGCVGLAATLSLASPLGEGSGSNRPQDPTERPPSTSAPAPVRGAADKNYPLFVMTCTPCHERGQAIAQRRTKSEWQEIIDTMIVNGAVGTEKEFETVLEFLRRYYGKVFINKAATDEIVLSLGLSSRDAEAIAEYRKANGNFRDFEALKQVPGIDVANLMTHRDAVAF